MFIISLFFFPFLHWKEMLNVAAFCFCMTVKEIGNFCRLQMTYIFSTSLLFYSAKKGREKVTNGAKVHGGGIVMQGYCHIVLEVLLQFSNKEIFHMNNTGLQCIFCDISKLP